MNKKDEENVYRVTNRIISILERQTPETNKAVLATLRNSAGKPLTKADEVWPILFENLPSFFLSVTGVPTYEENAIYTALQLYAIGRQGSSQNLTSDASFKRSMGKSLGMGRNTDNEKALDRRFNAMITAITFEEFTYHLRQMVKLVKSKSNITINFARLASDLYWYQKGNKDKICFQWATEYYYRENTKAVENAKEEETDES